MVEVIVRKKLISVHCPDVSEDFMLSKSFVVCNRSLLWCHIQSFETK